MGMRGAIPGMCYTIAIYGLDGIYYILTRNDLFRISR